MFLPSYIHLNLLPYLTFIPTVYKKLKIRFEVKLPIIPIFKFNIIYDNK